MKVLVKAILCLVVFTPFSLVAWECDNLRGEKKVTMGDFQLNIEKYGAICRVKGDIVGSEAQCDDVDVQPDKIICEKRMGGESRTYNKPIFLAKNVSCSETPSQLAFANRTLKIQKVNGVCQIKGLMGDEPINCRNPYVGKENVVCMTGGITQVINKDAMIQIKPGTTPGVSECHVNFYYKGGIQLTSKDEKNYIINFSKSDKKEGYVSSIKTIIYPSMPIDNNEIFTDYFDQDGRHYKRNKRTKAPQETVNFIPSYKNTNIQGSIADYEKDTGFRASHFSECCKNPQAKECASYFIGQKRPLAEKQSQGAK